MCWFSDLFNIYYCSDQYSKQSIFGNLITIHDVDEQQIIYTHTVSRRITEKWWIEAQMCETQTWISARV